MLLFFVQGRAATVSQRVAVSGNVRNSVRVAALVGPTMPQPAFMAAMPQQAAVQIRSKNMQVYTNQVY